MYTKYEAGYLWERDQLPIVQGTRWILTGAGKLPSSGIDLPYRPTRSKSLYGLHFSNPWSFLTYILYIVHIKTLLAAEFHVASNGTMTFYIEILTVK